MQIRIGNKQDEPGCRSLVEADASKIGVPFDLQVKDADLKNIESSYIGRDGIFLVAEEDQNVIAFAAAARGESENTCLLRRLHVQDNSRRVGLGKKMIEHVVFFARNLDYKLLLIHLDDLESERFEEGKKFLNATGFLLCEEASSGTHYELIL